MEYYWVITKDRIYDPKIDEHGNQGTSQGNIQLMLDKVNPSRFSLYDGDNQCYYEGIIYGDYNGFEPQDDFGGPNDGCVSTKINGEWL